jgi:MoaA/NifB/PqqE/SkfB family radical SAM enzyme
MREEEFALIISLPNGDVDFYDKACKEHFVNGQYDKINDYRIGDSKNLLKNKADKKSNQYLNESILQLKNPLKAPISASIEITRECNLFCKHCSIKAGKKRENEMSTDLIFDLINQLKEADVMSVFITGGECTLHKDFVKICQYIAELDMDCFVQTNGYNITESLLSQIPKSIYFVVSFDGINSCSKLHDGSIGLDTYEKIFSAFRKYDIPFSLQYVAFRDNLDDLPQTYSYCANKKIDLAALDLFYTGRALENEQIFPQIDQKESFKKLSEAKYLYEKQQQKFEKEIFHNAPNPYHFAFIQKLQEIFERSFPGVFTAYIASDGTVYPDVMHAGEGAFPQGNVKENRFLSIWKEQFQDIRELVLWKNWKHCKDCKVYSQFCDFRFPIISKNLYNEYTYCGTTEEHIDIMYMRYLNREATEKAYSNDKAREIDFW